MLVVLPCLCFALLTRVFLERGSESVRRALLMAAVACGLLSVGFVEFLSLGRWLRRDALALLWGLACVGVAPLAWRVASRRAAPGPKLSRVEWWSVVGLALLGVITGLTAIVAAPNSVDVLVYHVSRVVHWAQNHTVEFYPTHILRQLHQPPGAEYLILHAYVLAGGDRLVNLIAWSSSIGCMIATSLLAASIGLARRAQIVTALAAATIPMAQAEATGCKNDIVAAFWLATYMALTLSCRSEAAHWSWHRTAAAGALALALLTKGTAYVFAIPIVAWMLVRDLRAVGIGALWRLGATGLICVLVCSPHFSRNLRTYGKPLGPGGEAPAHAFHYGNDAMDARRLVSNVLRNVGVQITTPSRKGTQFVRKAIEAVHTWMQLPTNDAATTWGGVEFILHTWHADEGTVGSPLHALILIVGCLCWPWLRRVNSEVATLLLVTVSGFLLFSVLLKWQPWHARLHLPLLVLASPVVALLYAHLWRPVAVGVAILIAASSAVMLLSLHNRSWLGAAGISGSLRGERSDLYFATNPDWQTGRAAAFAYLRDQGIANVGLIVGGNEPEYLFWTLRGANMMRIEHVAVDNVSARYSEAAHFAGFQPQAVVTIPARGAEVHLGAGVYRLGKRYHDVALYLRVAR